MSNKEDIRFLAKVSGSQSADVDEVVCKLYLPRLVTDRPRLVVLPNPEQWHLLGQHDHFTLTGQPGLRGPQVGIFASDCYLAGGRQRHWGDDRLTDSYRDVNAAEISITREVEENDRPTATFALTGSTLLEPSDIRSASTTGAVTVERGEVFSLKILGECLLRFENVYRFIKADSGLDVTHRELVARADLSGCEGLDITKELLPQVDDLMLVLSLAEGHRRACMGLTWRVGEELTSLYRLNRVMPNSVGKQSINDLLIEDGYEDFLRDSLEMLENSSHRGLIWSALAAATSENDETVSMEFMRLYSALETLVLAYRREEKLEYLLDERAAWRRFEKQIRGSIKASAEMEDSPEKRKLAYQNIGALNRISLRHVTEVFLADREIRVDDLWPLFDNEGGWSLTTIRNKLTHGEHLDEEQQLECLPAAIESLKTIVYRVLLNTLGWDFQRSRAAWADWKRQGWREARPRISKE